MEELIFNEETHTYELCGIKLISVTQLLAKHGLAPDYSGVNHEVLKAKAERGTFIHKEIEDYIKTGEIGFSDELQHFINYTEEKDCLVKLSEFKLNNDIVAGTADLLLSYAEDEETIADIKTTSTLHKESVSWQLSLYAYLWTTTKEQYDKMKGQCYHFTNDTLKVVDINLKPYEEVDKLMLCERQGKPYKQELVGVDAIIAQIAQVEEYIASVEEETKAMKAKNEELKQQLMQAMENNRVKKYESDKLLITYVEPSTRTTIDSAKLKKEVPEVYEKYSKTSATKASLRITLRKEK